jgi:2-amino-4-hydroxy-6-hydroxymethyldihydropteridine diphosphokinase
VGPLRCASIYETEPLDGAGPELFLNTVACGVTWLSPQRLLEVIVEIEGSLERPSHRGPSPEPRTIDLDLLLYGDQRIILPNLVVPHPRMHQRRFVLEPLLELEPTAREPVSGTPYSDFLEGLGPQGVYRVAPPLIE